MDAFDPSMFPETVGIRRNQDGTDADAGPTEAWDGYPGVTARCYVRSEGVRTGIVSGQDPVTVSAFTLYFPTNPGVEKDDRIVRMFYDPHLRKLRPGEPPDPREARDYGPPGMKEVSHTHRHLIVLGRARPLGYISSDVNDDGREPGEPQYPGLLLTAPDETGPALWSVSCQSTE